MELLDSVAGLMIPNIYVIITRIGRFPYMPLHKTIMTQLEEKIPII